MRFIFHRRFTYFDLAGLWLLSELYNYSGWWLLLAVPFIIIAAWGEEKYAG